MHSVSLSMTRGGRGTQTHRTRGPPGRTVDCKQGELGDLQGPRWGARWLPGPEEQGLGGSMDMC